MPHIQIISGKQGAAVLVAAIAGIFWITEILRWTIYYGKVPGSYMPDWMATAWMLCLLGSPMVSVALAFVIWSDRRERFTPGFAAAVVYGCSPPLLLVYLQLLM